MLWRDVGVELKVLACVVGLFAAAFLLYGRWPDPKWQDLTGKGRTERDRYSDSMDCYKASYPADASKLSDTQLEDAEGHATDCMGSRGWLRKWP